MTIELLAEGYQFLEAPRTDAKGNFYFSDIVIGGVFRRSPDGRIDHLIPDRTWIGGMAMNHDGRIIVSGHGNLMIFDPESGDREVLVDSVEGEPIRAINDIQPDGDGGLYCGLIDPAAQSLGKAETQPLVHLTADRKARRVAEGIAVTNGIGLSPDRKIVYQVETMEGVLAYDRAPDGSLSNRRLAVEKELSDGMAVDSEGYIWVACTMDWAARRYAPDGTLDRRVEFPVREVSSLVFGGEDLRDLYVVTGSALNVEGYEHTGRVYRMRVDVPGQTTPLTRF